MTTREIVLVTKIIAEQTIKASVGRMSKSVGHIEMTKSEPRVVLLYTESVSAEVPRIVSPARSARRVRPNRTDSTIRTNRCLFWYPASLVSNS